MAEIETLLEDLSIRVIQYRTNNEMGIASAIAGGHLLADLKARCQHGDFLHMVKASGLTARTAQRWMRLAETGLKSDTVAYLGGIVKSLETIRVFRGDYAKSYVADCREVLADMGIEDMSLGEAIQIFGLHDQEILAWIGGTFRPVSEIAESLNQYVAGIPDRDRLV